MVDIFVEIIIKERVVFTECSCIQIDRRGINQVRRSYSRKICT